MDQTEIQAELNEKKYQINVWFIRKIHIFATPFEKVTDIADVAQLARARDL